MPIRYAAFATTLIALLGGCAPSAPPAPSSGGTSTAPATEQPATTTETKPAAEGATAANLSIPESLRQRPDVVYGGLLDLRTRTFAVKMADESEGTVKFELTGVEGNTVQLQRVNSGALSATGLEKLELNDKGLMVMDIDPGQLKTPQLELPKDFRVGSTWTQKGTFEMETGVFSQEANLKAVATEKVKVKAGEFDAIKVTLTGTMTVSDTKGKIAATLWYAKNVGLVKAITTLDRGTDNPTVDQSIELASLK